MNLEPILSIIGTPGSSVIKFKKVANLTTTDATPTTWFSYPITQNSNVTITVEWDAVKSAFDSAYNGKIVGSFRRDTGNVVLVGKDTPIFRTDVSGTKPSIDFSVNVGTQSIDVIVTGKAGQTFVWSSNSVTIRENI